MKTDLPRWTSPKLSPFSFVGELSMTNHACEESELL